jgi:hypothetical protein
MSHAWSGLDPTQVTDPGHYSLGVTFTANQAITVTGIRVWAGASPGTLTNRRGRLWTTGGSQLAIATLPDNLPTNQWAEYDFAAPVDLTIGESATAAFDSGGNYGEVNHAFDTAVTSTDGAVTFLAAGSAPHGNGSFTTSVGSDPDVASSQNTFYGVDIVYSLTGGDTPPVIVGMSATPAGLTVTSTINATDAETLVGATYTWRWGDGTTTGPQSGSTASHTYPAGGLYAVLGTVTDSSGVSDSAAVPVALVAPEGGVAGLLFRQLVDALASLAMTLGVFDTVNRHEVVSAPGNGVTCAVWIGPGRPARGGSGLNSTTVVQTMTARLYMPLTTQPQDEIEPAMMDALDVFLAALSGDFTLGGLIREIDLLGQFGVPLSWVPAYQTWGTQQYRVITITIPCVINDVWQQVP